MREYYAEYFSWSLRKDAGDIGAKLAERPLAGGEPAQGFSDADVLIW